MFKYFNFSAGVLKWTNGTLHYDLDLWIFLMSTLPWKIYSLSQSQWATLSEAPSYLYFLTPFLPSFMYFQLLSGYFHSEITATPGTQMANTQPISFCSPLPTGHLPLFPLVKKIIVAPSPQVETSESSLFLLWLPTLLAFYIFRTYLLNLLKSIGCKYKKGFTFLESLL